MQTTEEMITTQEDGLVITAASELVDTHTNASGKEFVWGYYFCIENTSDEKITLVGKDWNITDSCGNSFSDTTPGFQGEIPEIEPGEYFEFNAVFYGSCSIIKASKKIAQNIKMPILQFNAGDSIMACAN